MTTYRITVTKLDEADESATIDVEAEEYADALWLAYSRLFAHELRQEAVPRRNRWRFE